MGFALKLDPGLIWIMAGLVLTGAEMLVPGVYLLWIGLAAIGTGAVVWFFAPAFGVAVAVFLVLVGVAIVAALKLSGLQRPQSRVNTPDAGLVGRHGSLVDANPAAPRVHLGDSEWAARLPRDVGEIAVGTRVRVDGVDGTTLIVRPD